MTIILTEEEEARLNGLRQTLSAAGVNYTIVAHEKTLDSAESGVDYGLGQLSEMAPTFILKTENGLLAAIITGSAKLAYKKIKARLGSKDVSLASPDIVRQATGAQVGTVALVNPGLPTIIDARLAEMDTVFGGCGAPYHTLRNQRPRSRRRHPRSSLRFHRTQTCADSLRYSSGILQTCSLPHSILPAHRANLYTGARPELRHRRDGRGCVAATCPTHSRGQRFHSRRFGQQQRHLRQRATHRRAHNITAGRQNCIGPIGDGYVRGFRLGGGAPHAPAAIERRYPRRGDDDRPGSRRRRTHRAAPTRRR